MLLLEIIDYVHPISDVTFHPSVIHSQIPLYYWL